MLADAGHIVVVDDDPSLRQLVIGYLEDHNIPTKSASNRTELNRHLNAWGRYFSLGYPRNAMRNINAYVLKRLHQHLKRRSQRGWNPPTDESDYHYFARLGLIRL